MQVGALVACIKGIEAAEVLCVKKVQKPEECASMCTTGRSLLYTNDTVVVASEEVPPTVRKVRLSS